MADLPVSNNATTSRSFIDHSVAADSDSNWFALAVARRKEPKMAKSNLKQDDKGSEGKSGHITPFSPETLLCLTCAFNGSGIGSDVMLSRLNLPILIRMQVEDFFRYEPIHAHPFDQAAVLGELAQGSPEDLLLALGNIGLRGFPSLFEGKVCCEYRIEGPLWEQAFDLIAEEFMKERSNSRGTAPKVGELWRVRFRRETLVVRIDSVRRRPSAIVVEPDAKQGHKVKRGSRITIRPSNLIERVGDRR
jgi:hypothetical protein